MGTLLTIVILIACIALILFVLVQNPKGGGLNSEFGSAVQLGGAKRATDILEKGTWGLAIAIAVIVLGMAIGGNDAPTDGEPTEFETDLSEIGSDADNIPDGGLTLPEGGLPTGPAN
ncbi:MAG: preprotein translocase subunit SecG [Crocinitomix sp.]|nr:preprotein translocase subunit SecG [Crocinitomix sp.]